MLITEKPHPGFVFIMNGGVVFWKDSKQSTTADSTTEVEYVAASEAAKEAVWMRKFLRELEVFPSAELPLPLYCDNNGAIAQAEEPRSHNKSKHIERRFYIITEIVGRGEIAVQKWWDMMADIMEVNPDNSPVTVPLQEVFYLK